MVLDLTALLLCSALSVDVASQVLKSCVELCKTLDENKAFLERSLSLLLLFIDKLTLPKPLCPRQYPCSIVGNGLSLRFFCPLQSFHFVGRPPSICLCKLPMSSSKVSFPISFCNRSTLCCFHGAVTKFLNGM